MPARALHTVLCVIFSLLFVVERGLPCLDDCLAQENDPCALEAVAHVEDAGDGDHGDAHHCDHCSCVCHVPAIGPASIVTSSHFLSSPILAEHLASVPTAPVYPPDHIPLR